MSRFKTHAFRAASPPTSAASSARSETRSGHRTSAEVCRGRTFRRDKGSMQLTSHQLRLRRSLFEICMVTPPGPSSAGGPGPSGSRPAAKDTQSQHLGLVVEGDHFSLQPLAQAGEARDMAPDAKILPRSRSRHLLRQETGASA